VSLKSKKPAYSVIVPVYCEAESIVELVDRIGEVFEKMGEGNNFEIVIVDDGSSDNTPNVAAGLCRERDYVCMVRLRRNCGKSIALMAGFKCALGGTIITIDGDLQDHPEDIPKLLEKLNEGFDVVSGWRQKRKDTLGRRIGSRLYNVVVGWVSGLRLHDHNCGLKAYTKRAVASLCIYGQYHRYTPLLAYIVGFKVTEVPVENSFRKYGYSKYRTFRYQGFLDLLSISFTHKFGSSPLHFFGVVSLILVIPSFSLLFYWLVSHMSFLIGFRQELMLFPRPLLSLALMVFLLGVVIFLVGFICDFVLYHVIRSNIDNVVALQIDKIVEKGGVEKEVNPSTGEGD
tara:strand:- start:107 stop:1138 length:1032 start_codon:yes stop_codon:yes gene_type:complete